MIYLLRHGETLWNRERRIQGHLDSALSPRGEAQARAMGRTLAGLLDGHTLTLMTSPLGRTRQTAALVAQAIGHDAARIVADDRLKEISWGGWDGFTRPEIDRRWPGALAERYADAATRWSHCPPGGESFASSSARAMDWLHAARKIDGVVVAVAHGAIGRVLRGLHARLGPEEALALDEPQDAFFRLHARGIDRIAAER